MAVKMVSVPENELMEIDAKLDEAIKDQITLGDQLRHALLVIASLEKRAERWKEAARAVMTETQFAEYEKSIEGEIV